MMMITNKTYNNIVKIGEVTGFLGSLKINFSEERRLKDIQNLICEVKTEYFTIA